MIKKIITLSYIASILLLFVQCKEDAKITPSENTEKVMEQKRNLVGGWKSIEVTDTVKNLAEFVIAKNNVTSPIKELSNASTQVVSGKNYKFDMLLENGEEWTAQVYVNIKKENSITTFEQKK
jgi:hypothetical protein